MDSMNDNELRQFFRDELKSRLDKLRAGGDVEKAMEQKQEFIASLTTGPVVAMSPEVNQDTYEVPTELYQLFLGKRLKRSPCLFTTGDESIDEAEEAMLDLEIQRSQLEDGMKVLDIGCGWGANAFWIIEKYSSCHVTCVSNSKAQMMYIDALAKEKGVSDRINCITADINDFDTTEKFDRVMAIGLFEHVTNIELLMKNIAKWLKDGGMLFTHTLGHREFPQFYCVPAKDEPTSDEHLKMKLLIISPDMLLYFQKDLLFIKQWILNGRHMAASERCWNKTMEEKKDRVLPLFAKTHGTESEENQFLRWKRLSLFFDESFSYNDGNEWISCQHLFKKR